MITPNLQHLASLVVGNTLAGRNLGQALQAAIRPHPDLPPQQRAALQDISYGTLRHAGLLRAILDLLLQKPLRDESLRCLLLVALYQLHYGKSAEYAVVDNAVRAATALGKSSARGLVNAVLRNFLRRRETLSQQAAASSEEACYSHPQWWIDRLQRQYPDDWACILAEGNRHPPMTLRINRRRTTLPAYLALLRENGIAACAISEFGIKLERPVPVARLPAFDAGWASVQDRAAQYAAPLLDVADGMRVLDACSAPGGKAAHLLELAAINLLALDRDAERLDMVAHNLDRLGLAATLRVADAATDTWWDGTPFDRILADVPCSASGVVRRNPDIKWLRLPTDLEGFAAQQAQILDQLWRCLAHGGKLLYGTCSVFAEENQQQIADFLRRHPDAGSRSPVGTDGQLLPSDQQDGFYYALLHKA